MDRLANHLIYHFWQTIVFVIFAGGPVLILVPGPGLALNGPDSATTRKQGFCHVFKVGVSFHCTKESEGHCRTSYYDDIDQLVIDLSVIFIQTSFYVNGN